MVNEMHGKQANLVDWTGGQAKWAVHVSYQIFPKPPILCLHALLDGCENTGVSGTAWSLAVGNFRCMHLDVFIHGHADSSVGACITVGLADFWPVWHK